MTMTFDEVKAKKEWVANEVAVALQAKFNKESFSVTHGITRNEDGDHDFSISISDLDRPDDIVEKDVIEFARQKVRELVPGSKPKVQGMTVPRFL